MARVKNGTVTHKRHAKIRKATKGYRGKNNTVFRIAKQAHMKAGLHAYKGRKQKKRDFRVLWIRRISSALRAMGHTYSVMKNKWLHARMDVNRKCLSELAVNHPEVFKKVVEVGENAKKVQV